MVATMVAGSVGFLLSPPPQGPVEEWFALFDRNALLGMMDLDLAMLVGYVALIPVVVALCVRLWRTSPAVITLAAAFSGVGIAAYLASSRVFEMLALSQQYAAATTVEQKASLAAAGQSMLTTYLGSFGGPFVLPGWNLQGTAFIASFVLWCGAGIAISAVMVRSGAFGKTAGWIGIAAFAAALGLFLPVVGVTLSLIGVLLELVWFVLIGRRLLGMARGDG